MADPQPVVTNDGKDGRLRSLLALFLVYRFCYFLPVPSLSRDRVELLLSQAHISNYSVATLAKSGTLLSFGLSPYLTSIYFLAIASLLFPVIERMQKASEVGRLGRWTIGLSFVIATYASIRIIGELKDMHAFWDDDPSVGVLFVTGLTFIAGYAFVLWLVGRLGDRGWGSGLGLIVFASTVAQLPRFVFNLIEHQANVSASFQTSVVLGILLFLIVVACVAVWSVFQGDRAVIVCVALAGSITAGDILTLLPEKFEPEFFRATAEPLAAQQPLHYLFLFVLIVALWSFLHSSILRKKEDQHRSRATECFVGTILAFLVTGSDLLLAGLDLSKFNLSGEVPPVLSGYGRPGPGGAAFIISVFVSIEIANKYRKREPRFELFRRRRKQMPKSLESIR